jgi:hypothetical protein
VKFLTLSGGIKHCLRLCRVVFIDNIFSFHNPRNMPLLAFRATEEGGDWQRVVVTGQHDPSVSRYVRGGGGGSAVSGGGEHPSVSRYVRGRWCGGGGGMVSRRPRWAPAAAGVVAVVAVVGDTCSCGRCRRCCCPGAPAAAGVVAAVAVVIVVARWWLCVGDGGSVCRPTLVMVVRVEER